MSITVAELEQEVPPPPDLAELPRDQLSRAEILALLEEAERIKVLASLDESQAAALHYRWDFWARPDQRPPSIPWSVWNIITGRGTGKALDLRTPIPTPHGWTTMGELQVGDELFAEDGSPCRVTFATEVQHHRRCYEVVFSDGSTIVADAEHRWLTWTHAARKAAGRRSALPSPLWHPRSDTCEPAVRTTAEILATLYQGSRGDLNHSIPLAAPLRLPDVALPVAPYTLGIWLGDGSSAGAEVTTADPEVLEHIAADGYAIAPARAQSGDAWVYGIGSRPPARDALGRMTANGSVHSTLRAMGLLKNKHIPAMYLRASERQRRDLLAGLMDSDGTIEAKGAMVEFTNTREALARGVYELVVSLGMRASVTEGVAKLNGRVIGPKWRVVFRPDRQVFRLKRKADRFRPLGAQGARNRHRMVVDVRPVASRPVRCITVDSPSSLFLAGAAMVPTHNTRTGSEWTRQKGPSAREGVLIGANPRDVRDIMIEGRSGILSVSPNDERPIYQPSKLKLTWPNGAVAHIRSAEDPESIRGLSIEWAWCDEIAKWRYLQESWDMLRFAMREGRRPQTLVTTTPKPLELIIKLAEGRFPGVVNAPVVSTYRNKAHLADEFLREIAESFEGTRLGAQELHGRILTDVEGALWSWALVEAARWKGQWTEQASGLWAPILPEMKKKVCAVDPTGSKTGAECGIVVVGIDRGRPPIAYVLDDRSRRGSPYDWGRAALRAYFDHDCNVMIGETNYGGEMVEHTIKTLPAERDPKTGKEYPSGDYVRFDTVTAGISKKLRAEPAVALYEQTARGFRRVYHVGTFGDLESQLTAWVPDEGDSPDRLDALVWGINYLIGGKTFRGQASNAGALVNLTMG